MEVLEPHEILLDAPRTNKPIENADTPSLIVGPTCTRSAERLLPNNSACTFFVVVDVASGVAKLVGCVNQGIAVRGETANVSVGLTDGSAGTYMAPVNAYSEVESMSSSVFS